MTDDTKPLPVEIVKQDAPKSEAPASASKDPAVALAGIPVTRPSNVVMGSTGPAVPSVDNDLTEASPNKETSSPAPEPSGATKEVSGK